MEPVPSTNASDVHEVRIPPQIIRVPALSLMERSQPHGAEAHASTPVAHRGFVQAVRARWGEGSTSRPKAKALCTLLDEEGIDDESAARIVVLGDIEVPEPHDRLLEPEVITPPKMFWARNQGFFIFLGVGIGVNFVMDAIIQQNPLASVPAILGYAGAAIILLLISRKRARNEYMRFAPGIVQFLRFSVTGRGKPRIRSYPMTRGTTVVLSSSLLQHEVALLDGKPDPTWWKRMERRGQVQSVTLMLLREGQMDTVPIGQLPGSEAIQRKLFDALVSTATIPELSDTELTC